METYLTEVVEGGRLELIDELARPDMVDEANQAFGHNGAGGQLAWADPATGLSLGYVTNGYDRHEIREPRRGTSIASLAAVCLAD